MHSVLDSARLVTSVCKTRNKGLIRNTYFLLQKGVYFYLLTSLVKEPVNSMGSTSEHLEVTWSEGCWGTAVDSHVPVRASNCLPGWPFNTFQNEMMGINDHLYSISPDKPWSGRHYSYSAWQEYHLPFPIPIHPSILRTNKSWCF